MKSSPLITVVKKLPHTTGQSVNGKDLLTRTIVHIDEIVSAPTMKQFTHALQHVPGVLVVESDGSPNDLLVLHDESVPTKSFVLAAVERGIRAHIAARAESAITSDDATLTREKLLAMYSLSATMVLISILISVEIFYPNSLEKTWLVASASTALWVLIVFKTTNKQHL
jgi:hypothetical protein